MVDQHAIHTHKHIHVTILYLNGMELIMEGGIRAVMLGSRAIWQGNGNYTLIHDGFVVHVLLHLTL